MVKGLDTFQKYFADYEEQYVLIGGAACDILFESNEVNFRATRDLDMVLIVEALTPEFGEKFWELAKKYGATTLVDMAQTAGVVDCNVGLTTFDFMREWKRRLRI